MTLTLHLGVVDVPYVDREPPAKQARRIAKNHKLAKPKHAEANEKTTGDVATIIEEKYHLFETFYEVHEVEIVEALTDSLKGSLENLIAGAPSTNDPFGTATSKIEGMFHEFLSSREAERVGIEGTPTLAARRGVNHRFKHPYAKANPRRPSFIDTGLMDSAFVAWAD